MEYVVTQKGLTLRSREYKPGERVEFGPLESDFAKELVRAGHIAKPRAKPRKAQAKTREPKQTVSPAEIADNNEQPEDNPGKEQP